jgi:hypothetical protein
LEIVGHLHGTQWFSERDAFLAVSVSTISLGQGSSNWMSTDMTAFRWGNRLCLSTGPNNDVTRLCIIISQIRNVIQKGAKEFLYIIKQNTKEECSEFFWIMTSRNFGRRLSCHRARSHWDGQFKLGVLLHNLIGPRQFKPSHSPANSLGWAYQVSSNTPSLFLLYCYIQGSAIPAI